MNYFGVERKRTGVKKLYKLNKEKSFLTLEDNTVKTWKLKIDTYHELVRSTLGFNCLLRRFEKSFGTVIYNKSYETLTINFMFDATKKEARRYEHLGVLTCV